MTLKWLSKLMIVPALLGCFLAANAHPIWAASTGTSTGQFYLEASDYETLRLESVPMLEFDRVAMSDAVSADITKSQGLRAASVADDKRGHLVVADERTAESRENRGWQVNAKIANTRHMSKQDMLDGISLTLRFNNQTNPITINNQNTMMWQEKPNDTASQTAFVRNVSSAHLSIPQQPKGISTGKYAVNVMWTLTDAVNVQEVGSP